MNASFLKRWAIGLSIFALYFVLVALPSPEGLPPAAQKAIALMICAVFAWSTEILPLGMSSILFTVLAVVAGIQPLPKVMAQFATPPIFFIFAMFCNTIAFQNSGLNRRVVLWATMRSKGSPRLLLFYLMMLTATISCILADIPAIAMMYPVALLLLEKNGCLPGQSNFGRSLMLGLPLASLIGGVGTPAGSSMNVLTLSLLQSTANVQVSFFHWTLIGIPMVLILTPVTWFVLSKAFPCELDHLKGMESVEEEFTALGRLSSKEITYVLVLCVNLALWASDSIHRIPLPVVAVLGATLFFLPGIDLIKWEKDKNRIGWDILMLVGASTALGMMIWEKGGALWIANTCLGGVGSLPVAGIIMSVCLFTIAIHLLIPVNTAIVAVLLPALVTLATMKGINPSLLAIPMGFSVSASLLLPLGPVPLVTYPAGYYRMFDLFRPGCVISVAWVVVMTAAMLLVAGPLGLI